MSLSGCLFFFFKSLHLFSKTEFLWVYLYKTWSKIFENLLNSDTYFGLYIIVSKNKTVEAKVCCGLNEFSSRLFSLLLSFLLPSGFWFVNHEKVISLRVRRRLCIEEAQPVQLWPMLWLFCGYSFLWVLGCVWKK